MNKLVKLLVTGWRLYVLALIIRLVLVIYAEWQDSNMEVKYTDIDYVVFSDAAAFVTKGLSPYHRSTYRYTPLLAFIMTPNTYIHKIFGKIVFVLTDIIIGILIHKILNQIKKPKPNTDDDYKKKQNKNNSNNKKQKKGSVNTKEEEDNDIKSDILVASWLLNPIAINVSTRGNAESIVSLLVLLSLYLLLNHQLISSAIVFGLASHFKIYPLLYSPSLYFYIDSGYYNEEEELKQQKKTYQSNNNKPNEIIRFFKEFFNTKRVIFTIISASTFFIFNIFFYFLYGWEFLWETYLYHVVRKDHRHNFSVYFYQIYLSTGIEDTNGKLIGLLSFLPQILILVVFSILYSKRKTDLMLCLFLQTFTFVTFNKVCTVQYFVWYFSFLPLVLYRSSMKFFYTGMTLLILWFIGQGSWLYSAYGLEFLGLNNFYNIWLNGIFFFLINIFILLMFIFHHQKYNHTISFHNNNNHHHHHSLQSKNE